MIAIMTVIAGLIGVAIGLVMRRAQHEQALTQAREQAQQLITQLTQTNQAKIKTVMQQNRQETEAYRQSVVDELADQQADMTVRSRRAQQREANQGQLSNRLDNQAAVLDDQQSANETLRADIDQRLATADELQTTRDMTLVDRAGIDREAANQAVLIETRQVLKRETDIEVKQLTESAEANADRAAKDIVIAATESGPADMPKEHLKHLVTVPNGDLRSKLIGRDGQHIRLLETLTGTDLLFVPDDNTQLFISTHDPIRREIARVAVENLVASRRIAVTAIETQVANARHDVMNNLWETGEQVVSRLKVGWMHPDLLKLLGRLQFRTSYGQNVLNHSIEVAQLAGSMAAELGENVRLAKRAGLLHDIGKAIDHEVDGTHVEIGVEFATAYDEDPVVVNAIAAHHGDVEKTGPISDLVAAADAISGARPGARSESVEDYLTRLHDLEAIAKDQQGVQESYAIQAGRELRIVVKPKELDDDKMAQLTHEVAAQIEATLAYPGKIKVTTIRRLEADEYVGEEKKKAKKKRGKKKATG